MVANLLTMHEVMGSIHDRDHSSVGHNFNTEVGFQKLFLFLIKEDGSKVGKMLRYV